MPEHQDLFRRGDHLTARRMNKLMRELQRQGRLALPHGWQAANGPRGVELRRIVADPFWAIIKDHSAAGSYRGSDGAFSWIAAERYDNSGRQEWRESPGLKGLHGGPWPAKAIDGRNYVPPGTLVMMHPSPNNKEFLFSHQLQEMGLLNGDINSGSSSTINPYYFDNGTFTDAGFTLTVEFPTGHGNLVTSGSLVYINWFPDVDPTAAARGRWLVISAEC